MVSLSLADSAAEQQLSAPVLVQQLDLVNKVWPQQQAVAAAGGVAGALAGQQRRHHGVARPKVGFDRLIADVDVLLCNLQCFGK